MSSNEARFYNIYAARHSTMQWIISHCIAFNLLHKRHINLSVYRCRIAKTVFCHTILPSTSPLHKVFRQAYVSLRNFKCSSSDDFWQKMSKFHETFTQFQIKFSIFDNYWVFWKTFSSNMMIKSHFEQTYPDVSWHQYRWREKDRAGYANCACLPATLAKIIW